MAYDPTLLLSPDGRPAGAGKERIAIFYPWGNLGVFASLRDAIALMIERGCTVDFYTQTNPAYPAAELDLPGFTLYDHPAAFIFFTNAYPRWITRLQRGARLYRYV